MTGVAPDTTAVIGAAVRAIGLQPVAAPEPLPGGANNRVFRVLTGCRPLFVKCYYREPSDERDRLAAEFAFSSFAWSHGIRVIAEPIAEDRKRGIGIFAFVEGRRLRADEADACAVDQALGLVAALARHRNAPEAPLLPAAAEARFSVEAQLRLVGARVERLATIEGHGEAEQEAGSFVRERLVPAWARVCASVRRDAARAGIDMAAELAAGERCLSPSDFGLHNALRTQDGTLVFHDFEYAGWDDPAKLACDFFLQPALTPPLGLRERFVTELLAMLGLGEGHRARISLFEPVFRLKWSCIVLNEFLAAGQRRRAFAGSGPPNLEHQRAQLAKAEGLLAPLEA